MKLFIIILGLAVNVGMANADSGHYQEALKQTLESEALKVARTSFETFELTETKVEKVSRTNRRGNGEDFNVSLFYSAVGTAGGCFVDATVKYDQMEAIGRDSFQIIDRWTVEAKRGICPR